MAEPSPEQQPPVRFEQGLSRLERLVHDLEDGQLGLEEALKAYEEGVGLLRHCHTLLSVAERKIEILAGFDAEGNPITRPFPPAAAATTPAERRPAPSSSVAETEEPAIPSAPLVEPRVPRAARGTIRIERPERPERTENEGRLF